MSLLILRTRDKKIRVQGVFQPEADLIAFENGILVIKVQGHKYSYGRMPNDTGYAPTEFQVYKAERAIVDTNCLEISITAQRLLEFPLRPQKDTWQSEYAMKNLYNLVTLTTAGETE